VKRWLFPTGVDRDYAARLKREAVARVRVALDAYLLPALPDLFRQARADANIGDLPPSSGWFESLRQAFIASLAAAGLTDSAIRVLVRQVADRVDTFNRREFDAVVRSVYGADVPPAALRAAVAAGNAGTSLEGEFRRTLELAGMNQREVDQLAARAFPAEGEINRTAFRDTMRSVYQVDVIGTDRRIAEALQLFEAENFALIKSIPQDALASLHGKIVQAVQSGRTLKDTTALVREQYGITERRAELIARDQIGKLNGQLTKIRQLDVGVESYTWRGILDTRERPEHVRREGVVFRWDTPPEDGAPGIPIRCRCTAEPLLPSWEELERRIK
jgi:SPP1 gp7 family putative phage head morphogenesis protein